MDRPVMAIPFIAIFDAKKRTSTPLQSHDSCYLLRIMNLSQCHHEPGIVASRIIVDHAEKRFQFQDLGPAAVKGRKEPVHVFGLLL